MKKFLAIIVAILVLGAGCKPLENTVKLANTKAPVVRNDITFSYSADQIRYSDNNIKKGWANRNDIYVLNVKIINNTQQTIHGSQFSFISNGQELEIANNELASKKLKSKSFPTYVYVIPVFIVAAVIYAAIMSVGEKDTDGDGFDDDVNDRIKKSDKAKDPLYGANLIQKELYHFNIAKQVFHPGEQISGFIPFKSQAPIRELDIQIREVDYKVLGIY